MEFPHLHRHPAAPTSIDVPRLDWSALPIPLAVSVLAVLPAFILGTLAVEIRDELRFSDVALGALVTIFSGLTAVIAIPVARWVERVGHRRGLLAAALVSGVAMLGGGVLATEWWHLAVAQALAAGGAAAAMPSVHLSLAVCIPPERQGLAFGMNLAAIPGAILLAGVAVPLVAETVGWRWALGGAGTLALATAAAAWISFGHVDWGPIIRQPHPIQVRLVLLAGGVSFFGVAGAQAVATFAVEAGVQEGFSPGSVGYVLALSSVVSIAIRVLFGSLADKTGPVRAFAVLGALLAVGAGGITLLAVGGSFALVAAGTLLGLGVGWSWNGLLSYAVVRANPESAATASSVIVIGGFAGSAASPLLFGTLVSGPGYPTAWLLMAGVMAGAVVLAALAHREAARIHLA